MGVRVATAAVRVNLTLCFTAGFAVATRATGSAGRGAGAAETGPYTTTVMAARATAAGNECWRRTVFLPQLCMCGGRLPPPSQAYALWAISANESFCDSTPLRFRVTGRRRRFFRAVVHIVNVEYVTSFPRSD